MLIREVMALRTMLAAVWIVWPVLAQQPDADFAELLARPHVELEVLLASGARLAEGEHFGEAREIFARAVKDYPRNFEAHYNLALADIALRRLDEARTALEAPVELSTDQLFAREYLRGKIFDANGDPASAERSFTAALAGAPRQENYALDLGLFYLRQRQHPKAQETLEAGLRYHPESIYLLLGVGLAQYLDNDPPGAAATCARILTLDPRFGPAQVLLAVAHYTSGENEKCLKETAAMIGRPGAPPYLYYLNAASLLKLNSRDYALILGHLERATHDMKDCSFCYLALSKVHQEMGNEQAAIGDLETLVERVDPEFSNGWYRLANLYQHAGRSADAAKALERFHAIKTAQTDRETEYLRKFFLSELGAEGGEKK